MSGFGFYASPVGPKFNGMGGCSMEYFEQPNSYKVFGKF